MGDYRSVGGNRLAATFRPWAQAQAPAPAPGAPPAAPEGRPQGRSESPPAPGARRAASGFPAAPARRAALPPSAQPQDQQVQLIYAPWTKFCLKGQDANAKQVCFTGKDGRIESGQPVVAAVIIEPEGEPRRSCA